MSLQPEPPRVSVIVATYNRSATLRLALQSLLRQDCGDFEAWIVGDACVDDSAEAVASFGDPRLHWINLPVNSGSQGEPNNEGLRRARGRYVAFLGHDDLWFPWHLSGLLARIEESGADLVHSLTALLGPRGNEGIAGPLSPGRTYRNHHVPPSSWLHRRELVEDCGPWGEHRKLNLPVDTEFLWRVHRRGKRIECLRELSVVKFPSVWWGTYAMAGDYPQVPYLRALLDDPRELHRRVLLEAAAVLAQQRHAAVPAHRALWSAIRLIPPQLLDVYGRDRWPLAPLLRWRFQRDRRRWRRWRGLPKA